METSFDLLAWRDAVSAGARVPSGAELTEWACQLAASGCDGAAALLLDVATLHQGFSPQARADRRPMGGIARPFGRVVPSAGGDMASRAMAELQQLGRLIGATGFPEPRTVPPVRADPAVPHHPLDAAYTARLLRDLLEQPRSDRVEELTIPLGALEATARRIPGLDHRAFAFSPLTVLVPAIAAVGLIDFASRTRDLWERPLGSPALMHRVARLDAGGLGPYLANVGRLARNSRDVMEMARVARDAAAGTDDGVAAMEPWIALLSRGCGRNLLREVVDDLGDIAAGRALLAILDREASRPAGAVDVDLVMRLRDTGLDNADYALAARAQRVIARLRPDSELEGMILGSIEASRGEWGRAETTFRRWLARSPDHGELRERMDALRAGRFDPFVVDRGFGSPADRQARRLRRRGILPDHPRRRGERLDAVETR